MNDLFKVESQLPSIADFATGLQRSTDMMAPAGGGDLLRLGKDGVWRFGMDGVEVPPDWEVAFNPLSLQHGLVSWQDAKVVGERMVSMQDIPPTAQDMGPAPGDEWQYQLSIQLKFLTGELAGEQGIYKGSSMGMQDAIRKLAQQFVGQLQRNEPHIPVASLGVTSYQHKKWGRIYKPVLNVVRWSTGDEQLEERPSENAPKRKRG